jgi:hypothetical protein
MAEEFEEVEVDEKVEAEGEAVERLKKGVFYCPLYSIATGTLYPCLKERCMWWGGERVGCAIAVLVELNTIAEVMIERG